MTHEYQRIAMFKSVLTICSAPDLVGIRLALAHVLPPFASGDEIEYDSVEIGRSVFRSFNGHEGVSVGPRARGQSMGRTLLHVQFARVDCERNETQSLSQYLVLND